ncbi:unnamed protein product, partial [Adineta steineri]
NWSFNELVQHVREKCLSILEHSHYSLQNILGDNGLNQSNASFFETMLKFTNVSEEYVDRLCWSGIDLENVTLEQPYEVALFDFMLSFIYNSRSKNNRLSFNLICSSDLFDRITAVSINRRLLYCLEQLFSSNQMISQMDTCVTPISKLNLILPEEVEEIQAVIFLRSNSIVDQGMIVYFKCI